MKTILLIFGVGILLFALFGFVLPALFSSAMDMNVVIGIAVIVVGLFVSVCVVNNKISKEKK